VVLNGILAILPGMKARFAIIFLMITCLNAWSFDFRHGTLDLTEWNTSTQPVISLNGEWEFYWNKLLLSRDLKRHQGALAQLSIPWNEQLIDGQYLPKDGCATYALRILLPPGMDNVSFAVPAVFNCYAFWVNDKLICSSGKVGTTAAETTPRWRPQTVSVATTGDTLRVIFQIANFQHTRGGCAEIMRIGTTSYLAKMDSVYHVSGMTIIILFLIIAVAAFSIYFIVRIPSFRFVTFLCLAYTLRFLFSDLYYYYDFNIDIGWEWAARIEYSTIPLIVLSASLFIANIYPLEFKKGILYFFVIADALLVVITFVTPLPLISPLLVVLQVVGLMLGGYTIYVVLIALIAQRKGAWVTAVGTGVFATVGFYNIYAFITLSDLNRIFIHSGYALAMVLNVVSLLYRTPMRLRSEEEDILRFSDFYQDVAE
jgi:hypothetical protein